MSHLWVLRVLIFKTFENCPNHWINIGDDFNSVFTPISGYITLENATDSQVNGRIVLLPQVPQQVLYSHFFALQDRGAIGIVYITKASKWQTRHTEYGPNTCAIFLVVPGQYFCTYNTGDDVQRLVIPVAEISRKEVDSLFALVAQGEEIFVSLSSEGKHFLHNNTIFIYL